MRLRPLLASLITTLLCSQTASAHFQLLQIDDYMRSKGGKVTLNMPFTHPSHGGPMMDVVRPESLTVIHKGTTQDLTADLFPLSWKGVDSVAKSFHAHTKLRGLGDYVFSLTPVPYFESSEGVYIQQFTKTIINVGGLPTDWDKPTQAVAEIVPDQQPYSVYAQGLFSGVVMANGEAKTGISVEVEFLNHAVNEMADGFVKQAFVEYPRENLNIITLKTDENGRFFFGVPHAGYWGFSALGVGAETEYKGKELSQDAVLWIQAHQLKELK